MRKPDDDYVIYSNKGGPPLRPVAFLFPYGEPVYFVWGRYAVNLGGGWLRVDLEHSNIRSINSVDFR